MKKFILVVATVSLLSSCSILDIFTGRNTTTPPPDSSSTSSSSKVGKDSTNKTVVQEGDTVGVDYVGRLEDGTIFDSSIEEYAKKTKNYAPGARTYKPFSFTVGAGQMIKWFDAGVVGMKLGEKKTLTIKPAAAYWEAYKEETASGKYFQDTFTEDVPADQFKDTIVQTVSKSVLGDRAKGLEVGKILTAGNVEAKVTKIDGDNITLSIENTQNPFYKKKLVVGLKGKYEDNEIMVKKITADTVTLQIDNKANPFYGKKLKEGLAVKTKDGQTVTISKIAGDNVTIRIPNTHELAGKTLIFDVEIKSIK